MTEEELLLFLEEKVDKYNRPEFIESDPISIPHKFSKREDIEIAGFLTATISWGQRITIIKNANELMRRMDFSPYSFILNHSKKDLSSFKNFKHRTFNHTDLKFFLSSLKNIYCKHKSLENVFIGENVKEAIINFRKIFLSVPHPARTKKHISNPEANSSAKRLNMFLRWMIRKDKRGVDFGIWKNFFQKDLMCPLDVHSGNVARKLGLLARKQNDWQAVEELTSRLREFDSNDPVKYDFALFGLGVFESR
ncbi:MAG: TIGR02757 family protein [Bacteroidetes bacterium]|nr:TIGR02757 family protein [Bacteroidota bacterium]